MTNSINGSQVEWRPEDVSDSVLLAVLLRAYHMFHLFQVHKPWLTSIFSCAGINLSIMNQGRVVCAGSVSWSQWSSRGDRLLLHAISRHAAAGRRRSLLADQKTLPSTSIVTLQDCWNSGAASTIYLSPLSPS